MQFNYQMYVDNCAFKLSRSLTMFITMDDHGKLQYQQLIDTPLKISSSQRTFDENWICGNFAVTCAKPANADDVKNLDKLKYQVRKDSYKVNFYQKKPAKQDRQISKFIPHKENLRNPNFTCNNNK